MTASIFFIASPRQGGFGTVRAISRFARTVPRPNRPCLKQNAAFDDPAHLASRVAALPEHEPGRRTERLDVGGLAAHEKDAVLPGRGHRERHGRGAGAV